MRSMILGNYVESECVMGDTMRTEVMFYLKANLSGIWYKFIMGPTLHLTLISVIDILETHLPLALTLGAF